MGSILDSQQADPYNKGPKFLDLTELWVELIGDRLMAGREFLVFAIGVRIPVPEQIARRSF